MARYNRLENREKLIDNICPPIRDPQKSFLFQEKAEGEKGGRRSQGGKGGGGFLFKPPKGALFGSPFPPFSSPQAVPAAADFLFATFSFVG